MLKAEAGSQNCGGGISQALPICRLLTCTVANLVEIPAGFKQSRRNCMRVTLFTATCVQKPALARLAAVRRAERKANAASKSS